MKFTKKNIVRPSLALLLGSYLIVYPPLAKTVHASPLNDAIEAWGQRSDNFLSTGSPNANAVNTAIESYRLALSENPGDLEIQFKLMEALYFKGEFLTKSERIKQELYQQSVNLSKKTLRLIHLQVGIESESSPPFDDAIIKKLQNHPFAARGYFWSAINWGLWGMAHGYLTSGRKGVAKLIRDHATATIQIDPKYADAGGYRLLGRMHSITPRIPLFTWWIDRKKGLKLLQKAYSISNKDPRNALFLAEALVQESQSYLPHAINLLQEAANHKPRADYIVEESQTIEQARLALKNLKNRK